MKLSEIEKRILSSLIHSFITSAAPVSSSQISRDKHLEMSSATIRHILIDLEQKGFIHQPHPSSGRIPVTQGYRAYVDELMKKSRLTKEEKDKIIKSIQQSPGEFENVLREATHILAQLSHQLGIIISPRMDEGIFRKMEMVSISSDKILIVISIESGLLKTITFEIPSEISNDKIGLVNSILNERLAGMRLGDIRRLFSEIVSDLQYEESGLLNALASDANRVFDFEEKKDIFFEGTRFIGEQPEFANIQKFTTMIELLENPIEFIHIIDENSEEETSNIKIGEEITEKRMQECSIIRARYRIGNISGTIGLIGPMRMNYSKLISLVEFTANAITEKYLKN
jgi:heat-inducible transcriptional repressor